MNIDTDTQWAYWDGLRKFEAKNRDFLQGQIGNPKGADKPNKSFYDPRKFIREVGVVRVSCVLRVYGCDSTVVREALNHLVSNNKQKPHNISVPTSTTPTTRVTLVSSARELFHSLILSHS